MAESKSESGPECMVIQSGIYEEAIVATIRIEYLKLAIIVVLIIIILWYIYTYFIRAQSDNQSSTNSAPMTPEHFGKKQVNAMSIENEPIIAHGKQEDFAPYASWLTPDIYNSDASHDVYMSNTAHYGMYAPYDLDYMFPSDTELPANRKSLSQIDVPAVPIPSESDPLL
jgi:hypothetical protein